MHWDEEEEEKGGNPPRTNAGMVENKRGQGIKDNCKKFNGITTKFSR